MTPPDSDELDQAYTRLKELHAEAFDWMPPDVAGLERLGATQMRQYVRAWINEWDLVRLDPGYLPETGVLAALAQAAASKEVGRTMLLVMRSLGPGGPEGANVLALGDAVRALKRAGLEADARRLALEALMAVWPRRAAN